VAGSVQSITFDVTIKFTNLTKIFASLELGLSVPDGIQLT
jgi:hypothetical protein